MAAFAECCKIAWVVGATFSEGYYVMSMQFRIAIRAASLPAILALVIISFVDLLP
jgi:hypothetical protein